MIPSTDAAIIQQEKEYLAHPRELSSKELGFSVKIDCKFSSTRELSRTKDFVGQERALAALDIGLGVAGSGYNIFVSGLSGAEKLWRTFAQLGSANERQPLPHPGTGLMSITSNFPMHLRRFT